LRETQTLGLSRHTAATKRWFARIPRSGLRTLLPRTAATRRERFELTAPI
jgi:hypothetical protein